MRGAVPFVAVAFTAAVAVATGCGGGAADAENRSPLPPRTRDDGGGGGGSDSGKLTALPIEEDASTNVTDRECDPLKPFGTPMLLLDPTTKSATPRLSHDELTVYFTSDNTTTSTDLFRAVRATRSASFGTPVTMTTQSSASNDNDPAPSFDHLSLFFHSGRSGNNDLWMATRASTSADFGVAAPVPDVNDATAGDSHPYYRSGGGGELYFTTVRGGSTTYRIYVAKKNGAGFATPTVVSELVGAWNDWQPMVTEDGLTMLFASDRPTAGAAAGYHLFLANRASENDPWGTPQAITEVNSTAAQDFAGWISADRCRIYFSSSRDSTLMRVYFAARPL